MKQKRKVIILILLLILLTFGGFYYQKTVGHRQSEGELQLYGNVDIRQVEVAFYGTGRIKNIFVHEGDRVKVGQLLAEIDPVRMQADLKQKKAELLFQQQVVTRLEHGSRPEEIQAARDKVNALKAQVDDAQLTYKRQKQLYAKNGIARQKVDDAQAKYLALENEKQAAEQILALAVKGPREEDIVAARAKLQAQEAAVVLSTKILEDAKVYASADGVIQDRIMEPGDMAFPNLPVLTLARTNPVWVRAYVPEPDLGKIWQGMKVSIGTDSFPEKKYRGWVGFISPTAEFTPKNVETPQLRTRLVYQVRVYACDSLGELRLGMPATVTFDLQQSQNDAGSMQDVCGE